MQNFPEFGNKVVVVAEMEKHKKSGAVTAWERFEFESPRTGIYIGKRTVFDGKTVTETEYADEYGGRFYTWKWFDQRGHHNYALVVLTPRTNPIYVALEDMELA